MDLSFTKEQEAFRQEVRDFVQAELEAGTFAISSTALVAEASREFSLKMAKKGWIGLSWPTECYGQGRSYVDKMIMNEELFNVQAPLGFHFLGDRQIAPGLIEFGSDWQKEYFLPRIAKATEDSTFCLLFSEPNAGSDLVAVSTTAVEEGDAYILNGQKTWTSGGHQADWGWILVRTLFDEAVPNHKSCSEFIVDLKSPGVTIRPIINSAGVHDFNEVFFDNVKIERKNLVGKLNEGFKQIMAQMDFERAGMERLLQNYPIYSLLLDHVKEMVASGENGEFCGWVKDQVAQVEIEYNIGRLLCYRTAWMIDSGKRPTSQAAIAKMFCTQLEQRVNDLATKVLGPVSQIKEGVEWTPFPVDVAACYLWGASYTLQGGSVEILKNIVAQRGLGLPRR
jgi:alkylation response protein AidB-like acyl-CoA dehydrogenase